MYFYFLLQVRDSFPTAEFCFQDHNYPPKLKSFSFYQWIKDEYFSFQLRLNDGHIVVQSHSRIFVSLSKVWGKLSPWYLVLTERKSGGNALLKNSNRGIKFFPGNEALYWKKVFFVCMT